MLDMTVLHFLDHISYTDVQRFSPSVYQTAQSALTAELENEKNKDISTRDTTYP